MTFIGKSLHNATAYRCVETGVRYIIASVGSDSGVYRKGKLIFTGPRVACVNAVETDAKRG